MYQNHGARALRIVLAGLCLAASTATGFAEPGERRILVCKTLYNDLTAFDRRAWRATLNADGRPYPTAAGGFPGPMPAMVRNDPIRLRLVSLLQANRCEGLDHYEFFQDEQAAAVVPAYEIGGVVRAKN